MKKGPKLPNQLEPPAFSERMERRLRLDEARLPSKRTRFRKEPCLMPDCESEVHRSNRFPLCLNHLLLVWRHVDRGETIASWQKEEGSWTTGEPNKHVLTEDEIEAQRLAQRQRQREIATKPGTLYVLDAQNDVVKIGWTSRQLWQRLDQYPPHFRLIVSVPGTRADERDIHRSLKLSRSSGREWYSVTPQLVRQINLWIALSNTISAQCSSDSREAHQRANPDLIFAPMLLPKFTTLAEWANDGRNGPHLRPEMPAPKSRPAAHRVS